jgi:hypothetical protein
MHTYIPAEVIEKFQSSFQKDQNHCWNWKGFLDKSGLPVIRQNIDKKLQEFSPRRISLQLAGIELLEGKRAQPLVCRNKLCVNPEHLVMGDAARFWAKVHKLNEHNGCWVWIAAQDKDMYGKFTYRKDGKKHDVRAHIYSWMLRTGMTPCKVAQVCHKCDHPYCVNPDHLFLGTTQDNTQDKVDKGRQAKGESIGCAKLKEFQVMEIRRLYAEHTYTQSQLSDMYGVVPSVISAIIRRESWRHI